MQLIKEFTEEEVKADIFSSDRNKSPRKDGYGSGFYKAAWSIVGKDITKAVLERLKEAASHIVANNQSAFVQDLRRAYDMVSWEFLEEALKRFGFLEKFIRLVMTCVSTPKFTIKINEERQGYFDGQKGLRQGDTLSPLLFVLELLLTWINHMFVAGVPDQVKAQLLDKTRFAQGIFPIRYLRLPLSSKKWSKLECQQLVTEITSRITITYARQLSYAGRLQRVELIQWTNFQLPAGELKQVLEYIKRKHGKAFQKEVIAAVWGAMTYQT
ncbi:PREDICTED: uncharacterized protein LOC109233328 [Nicotiana attenuata]|uniref:uncharacterized protein LOC109233328 n=1 Tax=Nicotiana attenuata TaxID=49451 RepID=UPI000904FF17|nr:PREDICTED: uncharacterized protein LOC109233328 [Nicotiana attenuata]